MRFVVAAALVSVASCSGGCDHDEESDDTSAPPKTDEPAKETTTTRATTTSSSTSTSTTGTTVPLEDVFVTVSFPPDDHEFTMSRAVFRGRTTPGTRIEIGSWATTADDSGRWSLVVTLGRTGRLPVKVVAIDPSGEVAEVTIEIVYQPDNIVTTTSEPSF